jgi:hypothetical protein
MEGWHLGLGPWVSVVASTRSQRQLEMRQLQRQLLCFACRLFVQLFVCLPQQRTNNQGGDLGAVRADARAVVSRCPSHLRVVEAPFRMRFQVHRVPACASLSKGVRMATGTSPETARKGAAWPHA